jgi:long-chain acyl-CoA synthetase
MTSEFLSADRKGTPASGASAHLREPFSNAVDMFWHAVDHAGERTALIDGDRRISYSEYGRAVAAVAQRLVEIGVEGERVAILIPNSIEANIAIFAALAAGAQVTMLNPAYTASELGPLLASATPRALLVRSGYELHAPAAAEAQGVRDILTLGEGGLTLDALISSEAPRPTISIDPDGPATLMFTGGTTGVPKGVERSHSSLMKSIVGMHQAWPTKLDTEMWLNVAPVSHVWGFFMGGMNPVYSRSPLVIVPRFKPDLVLEEVERNGVTVFSGGPAAIYVGLLASDRIARKDLSTLRVCPGGGSSFLLETLTAWEQQVGVPIIEAFGSTEGGPITCNPLDGSHRYGTVGRPLPGMEIQIVDIEDQEKLLPDGDVGEIRIRGPRVISRYRGDPEGHPEGWLCTGDVGVIDPDGFLRLVDRKKDMLIVNGFNVYPREVEEVLARHPAVAEAAVVGIPNDRKGEAPVAFAVLRRPGAATADDLLRFCAEHLVAYKLPQRVVLVDAIEKTAANKVDRKRLAQIAIQLDADGVVG